MTKITIPVTAAEIGGALHDFVYNKVILNSQISSIEKDGIKTIEDASVTPGQELVLNQTEITNILDAGGEIEGYLFGIKQPKSSGSINIPDGVPSRLFKLGATKKFSQWFAKNASVWMNDVTNEILYYNQPNPSDGIKLKASEADIIRRIDDTKYSFLTIGEVKELVLNTDWVEL